PADAAGRAVDLVDADDGDGFLAVIGADIGDGRAEQDLVAAGLAPGVHGLGIGETLVEEAQAAINLAQALLAIDVITVFRTVAIAVRPFDDADDLRPVDGPELQAFGLQAIEPGGRDVV